MGNHAVQDEDHFVNRVKWGVKNSDKEVDTQKCLPLSFIVEQIYYKRRELVNAFTWQVRNNPSVLEEDVFFDWISKQESTDKYQLENIDHILTPEIKERLSSLEKVPGVYMFQNATGNFLYIGLSTNLSERVRTSFKERFSKFDREIYLSLCICKNATDAAILEIYFINKLNPAMNGQSKYRSHTTLNISPIPEIESPILCNHIFKKKDEIMV